MTKRKSPESLAPKPSHRSARQAPAVKGVDAAPPAAATRPKARAAKSAGRTAPRTEASPPAPAATSAAVAPPDRTILVARAAYFRAQARGFAGGHELDDWLAAEAEIDQQLAQGQ